MTPDLILELWAPLIPSLDRRRDLSSRLGKLYKVRIIADYVGDNSVDEASIDKAMVGELPLNNCPVRERDNLFGFTFQQYSAIRSNP